jgi:tetrapyrrole methylase family protein/MazG family protein
MDWFPFVERALDVLGIDVQEIQLADARAQVGRYYPSLSTDRPALIGPLTDAGLCVRLGDRLRQAYPASHEATVIAGIDGDTFALQPLPLDALGRAALAGVSLLYVPLLACPGAVETFQATVAHLRAPDGCPWDREQTHQSLRQGFLEESYEVLEALDRGDLEHLVEELGDVLLHILLQAQIGSESGEFRMSDIVCRVNHKIVYRHPHVFAGLDVDGVDEVLVNWEELKRSEKGERSQAPPFEGIPLVMPALARTQAILRRAKRLGFAPTETTQLAGRVLEAVAVLTEETDLSAREQQLGDLLFDLASLASGLHADAESALRCANARFESRFQEGDGAC